MNFSFNQPVPPARAATRAPSRGAPNTLDFSLAPRQGATDNSPFSRVAGAHVGPDWRNELSAWVRSHAYYPEQAAFLRKLMGLPAIEDMRIVRPLAKISGSAQ